MIELLLNPDIWLSFATLAALEIVLGVDNLIFISIVASRLPEEQQPLARRVGLIGALAMRILMLLLIAWIVSLTKPAFNLFGSAVSWRDIILISGGLFLLIKGTLEIHHAVEGEHLEKNQNAISTFGMAVAQIMALDLVFSLDSIITAVGMTPHIEVMIAAVITAVGVMLFAADHVSQFIQQHPTAKMLALSFLLLIGVALIADGLHFHIPRGYLYFAIAFAIIVEGLNLLARSAAKKRRTKRAKLDL